VLLPKSFERPGPKSVYSGLSAHQIYDEWKSTLHPDDLEAFENWWQDLQRSPKLGQTEYRIRRVDGQHRWFQILAAPVLDAAVGVFIFHPYQKR